jgi:hypothetical protein
MGGDAPSLVGGLTRRLLTESPRMAIRMAHIQRIQHSERWLDRSYHTVRCLIPRRRVPQGRYSDAKGQPHQVAADSFQGRMGGASEGLYHDDEVGR